MTGPTLILQRTPTWAKVLLGILAGALIMWGVSCNNERNRKQQEKYKATRDSLVAIQPLLDSALRMASSHTDTVIKDRVIYTDRILAGNRPSIPRAEVVELANKCTEVEQSCAEQKKAAQALIDNLKAQVAVQEKRIAYTPPRFNTAIEAGYDFTTKDVPVRGRAQLRLGGPISLVGEVELRASMDSFTVKPSLRALVNYSFK